MTATHRLTFPFGDNDFLIETQDGRIYSTDTERTVPAYYAELCSDGLYALALEEHQKFGNSSFCAECQKQAAQKRDYQSQEFAEEILNSDYSNFEPKPTPPICDHRGRVKNSGGETRSDTSEKHLGRYGY